MILIIGFTCPLTMHFKLITKCNKCSYKVRQLILLQRAMVCYFKVRQVFLQSATAHPRRPRASQSGRQNVRGERLQ